jgi:hypothetical protein
MPHIKSKGRPVMRATVALALLLACLGLAACGSSSKTSATNASAAAATTSGAGGTGSSGARGGRFAALRECLQKNGVTLPKRTPGQGRPPAGGFLGGGAGRQLPKGVTPAQFQAALKKCGGPGFSGGGQRFNNPAFRTALTKFAACMSENGVKLPAPKTSGGGPIFGTQGVNTQSAQFKSAEAKCRSDLTGAGLRRGAPGGGPPNGPPPGASSSEGG